MTIVTGGRYNGKLDYVIEGLGYRREDVLDLSGLAPSEGISYMQGYGVLYHLEAFIKAAISQGVDYDHILKEFISNVPDCVIICDEIGSGIIPVNEDEEAWREAVGRIMCKLARMAGGVTRVTCGIPEVISYVGI